MESKHKIVLNVLLSPRFRFELSNKYAALKAKDETELSFSCWIETILRNGMEGL